MSNIAFLLLCCADAAWCTGAWLLLMLLPSAANAAKAALPDRETQWQWRTEQRQNVAQKLPNASSMSSETVEKLCQTWPSCCCAVLMLHGVQRQPNVLFPGALPLASAGVGGYLYLVNRFNTWTVSHGTCPAFFFKIICFNQVLFFDWCQTSSICSVYAVYNICSFYAVCM